MNLPMNIQPSLRATWLRKERVHCIFCVTHCFDKKNCIFSASDLPWASHWNSKGLRLINGFPAEAVGLACQWGCCHLDSPVIWTVTFNCRSTNLIHYVQVVSVYQKVTFKPSYGAILERRQDKIRRVDRPRPGYHQINWDTSNLWSWACWYRRNSYWVNISAWSSSSAVRKPASIASATDMERVNPCAGLGNCDSTVARSLKPFFSCFFVDGLLCLLLVRSGIHVFFIVLAWALLCWRWIWNVQSSVTKTCVYHHIPGYFGISLVMFNFETSNHVKLGYLTLTMHIPV